MLLTHDHARLAALDQLYMVLRENLPSPAHASLARRHLHRLSLAELRLLPDAELERVRVLAQTALEEIRWRMIQRLEDE